jgi:hypothetical protein
MEISNQEKSNNNNLLTPKKPKLMEEKTSERLRITKKQTCRIN